MRKTASYYEEIGTSDVFLSDKFGKVGNDLQEFYKMIDKISGATEVTTIDPMECHVLSIMDLGNKKCFVSMDPEDPVHKEEKKLTMDLLDYDREHFVERFSESIIKEAEDTGFYLCFSKDPKNAFPVSNITLRSVQNRTGLGGSAFEKSSVGRNLSIAECFQKISKSENLFNVVSCVDEDMGSNARKIFGIMSGEYTEINQNYIKRVLDKLLNKEIDGLGTPECRFWETDHCISRIFLSFPDAENELKETYELPDSLIPGIMIETSDIGMSAFRLKGFFMVPKTSSMFFCAEDFTKMHSGSEADENEFIKAAENKIFPKFTLYPKKLLKLLGTEVVEKDIPAVDRKEQLEDLFKDVMDMTGLKSLLGKKRMKTVKESFMESFDKNETATAYDIAMFLMGLDRLDDIKSSGLKRNIQMATAKVLDYNFN